MMTYKMLNRVFRIAQETNLHCGEDHTPVYVLELRHDTFADVLALFLVMHNVSGQCVEDGDPAPFSTLVERNEKFAQDSTGYFKITRVGRRRARLRHGRVMDVR